MEPCGQRDGTGCLGRKRGWWETVPEREINEAQTWSVSRTVSVSDFSFANKQKLNTNWPRQHRIPGSRSEKSRSRLSGFGYGLLQKFMPLLGLLLPFSAVLSALHVLVCSVLCAGLGPMAPVRWQQWPQWFRISY